MRVLSVSRPWPWAFVRLGKPIENRKRKDGRMPTICRYRGPLLLHAARSWDPKALSWMFDRGLIDPAEYSREIDRSRHPAGVIFARCRVVEHICPPCPTSNASRGDVEQAVTRQLRNQGLTKIDLRWWMGGYALVLADIQPMPLIACRGQLGLWTLPLDVMRQVNELIKKGEGV